VILTQSLGPRVDARNRTVEGKDVSDAESTVVEREIRALVTVERQSTTVPKTSKRRAFGGVGLVVDIFGGRFGVGPRRADRLIYV